MRSVIVTSALLLALGACIGVFTVQRISSTEETVGVAVDPGRWTSGWGRHAPIIDDFDHDEATGSIGPANSSSLWLSDEERGFVFLGVINLPDVPDTPIKAPGSPRNCRTRSRCTTFPRWSPARYRGFATTSS